MPDRRLHPALAKLLAAATLSATPCLAQQSAPLPPFKPAAESALPRPFLAFSHSAQALADSVVAMARRQIGVPYHRGASSPDHGFDCSGLVKYVMEKFDIYLPRTSTEQARVGTAVDRKVSALRPGDLLTFGRGKRISHIGIYIGNGRYVHAPSPGRRVREASLLTQEVSGWWKGARRMIVLADTVNASAR